MVAARSNQSRTVVVNTALTDVNSDEASVLRPAAGTHVHSAVVEYRTATHDDSARSGAGLSVARRPQRDLVYRPTALLVLAKLVVDAGVAPLVALFAVRRLTSRGRRRRFAADRAAVRGGQRRLGQRRGRGREAQSGVRVYRADGGLDVDRGVVVDVVAVLIRSGRRRRSVVDDVWIENEVVMLIVGQRRVRQLRVAVDRRSRAAHRAPAVVGVRPRPDAAHLGGQLRRRSGVSVTRARRLHRPHRRTRVHLDGRLMRRRRPATPFRRPVRYRRQRAGADHRAREDRLLVGVVHDEAVRVLAPGRQARLGGGRWPLANRPAAGGDHRHRLGATSRQLAAELKLRRRSRVDGRRTTVLMTLLELTSVTVAESQLPLHFTT